MKTKVSIIRNLLSHQLKLLLMRELQFSWDIFFIHLHVMVGGRSVNDVKVVQTFGHYNTAFNEQSNVLMSC